MALLPIGHRRRGAGLSLDSTASLERALILSRHKGQTWYVDSNVPGGVAGSGDSWASAFLTLAAAVSAALADDTILVAPAHAETIAAATTISKAGLTIIGLGHGARRPTITMSATASKLTLSGAGISMSNILFLSTAACTIVIAIGATDVQLEACEFRRTSGTVPALWIDVGTGLAANTCDRFMMVRCRINTGTNVGATGWVELGAVNDQVHIEDCVAFGDFGDAAIHNPTGFVLTNLTIKGCDLRNLQTGDHAIELVSACTGHLISNNYFTDMTQQTGCDPGSCFSSLCFQDDVIDTCSIITPVIT